MGVKEPSRDLPVSERRMKGVVGYSTPFIRRSLIGRSRWIPTSTVFNAKRLTGRKFSDENVQKDMTQW